MKLFEVTNGFWGDSFVHVVCVAESMEKAIEVAREKFKAEAEIKTYLPDGQRHPPAYYENLSAELLCADLSNGFCTEIYD